MNSFQHLTPAFTGRTRGALFLACSLTGLGACGSYEPPEQEPFFWEPFVIYTSHGQFLDLDKTGSAAPYVHQGIDIAACPDGQTKVLALETGYIVRTSFVMPEPEGASDSTYHNIIISNGDKRTEGILYMHLADCPWALGDRVEAGEYIGSIANYQPSGYEHLHLQLVERHPTSTGGVPDPGSDDAWGLTEARDLGNPLVLLPERLPGILPQDADCAAPSIHSRSPEGAARLAYSFYAESPEGEEKTDPLQLSGPIAIVAELQDQCTSGGSVNCTRSAAPTVQASDVVAPLGFKLVIRTAQEPVQTVAEFAEELASSGLDLPVQLIYHNSSVGTYDERCLRFVLTYDPTKGCVWKPETVGDYVLQLTVTDAAGHETQEPDFPIKVVSLGSP